METALLIILPIITAILAISSFLIARGVEVHKKGRKDGSLEADQRYIKEKITAVADDLTRITKSLNEHFERIVRTEESAKAAHRRLDEITNKGGR